MLPKFSIETPCITFDHPLYIKPFEISKSLQLVFVIRLSGFQPLMSFLGSIASVMESLGLKGGMEIIYATVTSAGYFLPESTIFELILSLQALKLKIKTINEMNKTKNEAEKRMNETENSQAEESESTDEFPFNLMREKSQESEKSPNCLISDLQMIQAQKNWGMRESQMSTKD